MRGLERFLMDLLECPDIAEAISHHATKFYRKRAERAIEASGGKIYYYPQPTPITENHPHRGYPGYYPLSKVLEEVLCE